MTTSRAAVEARDMDAVEAMLAVSVVDANHLVARTALAFRRVEKRRGNH